MRSALPTVDCVMARLADADITLGAALGARAAFEALLVFAARDDVAHCAVWVSDETQPLHMVVRMWPEITPEAAAPLVRAGFAPKRFGALLSGEWRWELPEARLPLDRDQRAALRLALQTLVDRDALTAAEAWAAWSAAGGDREEPPAAP